MAQMENKKRTEELKENKLEESKTDRKFWSSKHQSSKAKIFNVPLKIQNDSSRNDDYSSLKSSNPKGREAF